MGKLLKKLMTEMEQINKSKQINLSLLSGMVILCTLLIFNLASNAAASEKNIQILQEKGYNTFSNPEMHYSSAEKKFLNNSEPINVVISENAFPLEGIEGTGEVSGIVIDVLEKIQQLSGLRFEYILEKDYEKKYESLKTHIPITISIGCRESMDCKYRTSIPFLSTSAVLLGYKKSVLNKECAKIGVLPWTDYAKDEIGHILNTNSIIKYNTLNEAYMDLKAKKIDGITVNAYTVMQIMMKDSNLIILNQFNDFINFSFIFNNSTPDEMITVFDKCIFSMTDAEKASLMLKNTAKRHTLKNIINLTGILGKIILALTLLTFIVYLVYKSRRKIKEMTDYDKLTGARNLAKFTVDAKEEVRKNSHKHFLLLVFDIKNFSLYNSIYGKEVGDELLKNIVRTLASIIHKDEVFGRVTMDQFILLAEFISEDNLKLRIEDFLYRVNALYSNSKIRIACGCCILKSDYSNMEEDLEKAFVAHKLAKQNKGLKNIYYFKDTGEDFYTYRYKVHAIESTMENALAEGDFKLFLQPQYSTANEQMVGAEALVRWMKNGQVEFYPNEFISIFEENGFIIELDYYVFEEACKLLKYWMENNIPSINISINVSPRNFSNKNFPYQLRDIAAKYGINCSHITIEITENIAISNDIISRNCQKMLHDFGFRISIDDFGTGYSALSVLKDMVADEIKLDKSFFDNIIHDESAKSVVESIFYLVKKLNLTSVAEGIETMEQIEFLRRTDCDIIQGYYYAKPMPLDEINKLLLD